MATVIIPTKEQWGLLQELGLTKAGAVVLISPEIAESCKITGAEPEFNDYDYGGEADVWLDVIASENHYALAPILDARAEEEV